MNLFCGSPRNVYQLLDDNAKRLAHSAPVSVYWRFEDDPKDSVLVTGLTNTAHVARASG